MSAIFVHLSDIHFGQERDHRVHIHNDVKEQLIADAHYVVREELKAEATAILVTGDIAQSGIAEQYAAAGEWLDRLAAAIGCERNRVQMVPGNHDLDRNKLSIGAKHLLDVIRAGGPEKYEEVIGNAVDRASLFARFEDYERFCYGYQCELDVEAKAATNLHVELAPGRSVRFIRMNSALLCTGAERGDNPELALGERQFIIGRKAGEENIVLIHHPLSWYKDSEAVRTYMRSRARILITGHEHNPKVDVDEVEEGCDLMMLAAGATVPFKSDDVFTFTYNVIELEWDPVDDGLIVTMHPRAWAPENTRFEADEKRLGGRQPQFKLGCPNFRQAPRPPVLADRAAPVDGAQSEDAIEPIVELVPVEVEGGEVTVMPPAIEGFDLTLLRFFRDLLENERLRILVELDAIPQDSDDRMTRGLQRKLLEWLAREGKLPEVERLMDELMAERANRGG